MRTLYFRPVVSVFFFFLSFILFLAYSQPLQIGCLPYFHTWCGLSANLECRSEMYCTRLGGNSRKKITTNGRLGTIAQIWWAISLQLRHISTIGKNLLSSNIPSTYPHNMVNFGPLAAEICWRVWGTPANFNGFRLGSVTAPHSSSGCEPNFAALNRERHLYSAGRPSRWALAHISSLFFDCQSVQRLLRYGWILSDRFCYSERSIIDGGIPKLGVCTSFLTFIPDT